MYVFCYDPNTLAYTGGIHAEFDQLSPGEVLLPAWASKNPPPKHDSAVEWPFYLPDRDAWEVRVLPDPEPEPEPAPAEPPTVEAMQATLTAHLEAAQRLMDQMKKATEGEGADGKQ